MGGEFFMSEIVFESVTVRALTHFALSFYAGVCSQSEGTSAVRPLYDKVD